MMKRINKNNLLSYKTCTDSTFCYVFNFKDNTSSKLVVSEKNIKFDNINYKLDENTKVINPSLTIEYLDEVSANNILVLKIPIKNDIYPNLDFGINLVYLYNIN